MKKGYNIVLFIIVVAVSLLFYYLLHNKSMVKEMYKQDDSLPEIKQSSNSDKVIATKKAVKGSKSMIDPINKLYLYKLWKQIQLNGFDSPNILKLLEQLWLNDGEKIYYKELIDVAKNKKLSDNVNYMIVRMLASAYETGAEGIEVISNYSLPKSKKDEMIQEFIKDQIENPRGKESLQEALRHVGLVANEPEAQAILDSFLNSNTKLISTEKIYEYKLSQACRHWTYDSLDDVLNEIDNLPKDTQKKLFQYVLLDSQWLPFHKDENLKKKYIDYIKANMPPPPPPRQRVKIDIDQIEEEVLDEFHLDPDILATYTKEEQERFDKTIRPKFEARIQEKVRQLVSSGDDYKIFQDSIDAIAKASISENTTYYDTAKKMILDSDNGTFILTTLELLRLGDYADSCEEEFKKDLQLKKDLQEKLNKLSLSKKQKDDFKWYIDEFFEQ